MVREGLIKNYADLYTLQKEQILPLERMADKSAENLIQGIQKSKAVPYPRVLFGLGIRFVGETVAKTLCKAFPNIDALQEASLEDLQAVNEIGIRIAESVTDFFAIEQNRELIKRLKDYGLQLAVEENDLSPTSSVLSGKNFVISGVFTQVSRNELKKLIEENGGKVTGSISGNTDFLVAGENMGPSKLAKAEKLNTQIIDESTFLNMI